MSIEKKCNLLLRSTFLFFFVCFSLFVFALPGYAQKPSILIFSQRSPHFSKDTYVEMAYILERPLREGAMYTPVVYKPDMPEVLTALQDHLLTPKDITPILSRSAMRNISHVLNYNYYISISIHYIKRSLRGNIIMEIASGMNQWNTVFALDESPSSVNKGMDLSDAIHGLTSTIMNRLSQNSRAYTIGTKAPSVQTSSAPASVANPSQSATPEASSQPTPGANPISPSAANPASTQAQQGNASSSQQPKAGAAPPTSASGSSTDTMTAYDMLIERARKNGDVPNLIISLKHAITQRPRDIQLRRDLIRAYREKGWMDAGKEEAIRAEALAPDNPEIHKLLGDVYVQLDDSKDALNEYLAASKLAPGNGQYLVNLGDLQLKLGQDDDAYKSFQDALKTDPKNISAHFRIAQYDLLEAKYDDAINEMGTIKTLITANPSADIKQNCASILQKSEGILTDMITRMQMYRKDFTDGLKNREQTYKSYGAIKQDANQLFSFLNAMPDGDLSKAEALYSQAASLVSQSADTEMTYLQSNNDDQEKQASLLRLEAAKQISDAAAAVSAALQPDSPAVQGNGG
jgi:tetratricopeptide (TPR) repeat protein